MKKITGAQLSSLTKYKGNQRPSIAPRFSSNLYSLLDPVTDNGKKIMMLLKHPDGQERT